MRYLILALLVACAPTTRVVTRSCPVPVTAVLTDFFLGVALTGVAALKSSADKPTEAFLYGTAGTGLLLGTYVSEFTCLK